MSAIKPEVVQQAAERSLNWLLHAYSAHGQGGFPHSRWICFPSRIAWKKDYPETSGYLIENLLNSTKPEAHLAAIHCADWLTQIQSQDGYYHSGVNYKTKSAFNTSQILFGLDAAYRHTGNPLYFKAMQNAFNALIENIDQNGHFTKYLYHEGYFASYYSRSIWPLLQIDQKYFNASNQPKIESALQLLYLNKNSDQFFNHCGFKPNAPAISHSVAYTLEGFLESAVLCQNHEMFQYILNILYKICAQIHSNKKIPAYYNHDLTGNYSFICTTGQIQMCCVLMKAYLYTQEETFKLSSEYLLQEILQWQIKKKSPEHAGAFPSSIPIWGAYFPFRYTNWTTKFFLDACYLWTKMNINT